MSSFMRRMLTCAVLAFFVLGLTFPGNSQSVIALVGSGSNLPTPLYTHWIEEYNKVNSGIQVRYLSTGTVKGIEDITRGVGDFAAGEVPLTEEQMKSEHALVQIPTVVVALVPIYHLPGVKSGLHFSGPVLADIFMGTIKSWDDPKLKELNPGHALPHLDISVVHRSEGKGSNYIFTDFLSKSSAKWRNEIGKTPSPAWPVGVSASRGEDMMEKVKGTAGAIGYVELGFALNESAVSIGQVQNAAGKFVSATQESITAAYHAAEKSVPADFRASLTNAPGGEAYPIISFTWLYVPAKSGSPERGRALVNFIEWALTTGQQSAERHGYTPLPSSLVPKVLAKVHSIS